MIEKHRTAIRAWADECASLTADIWRLIRLANHDLYCGPIEEPEDGEPWPGFVAACQAIRDALPRTDLWVDTQSDCVCDREPQWEACGRCDGCKAGEDCEVAENAEYWVRYDSREVRSALVGRELAQHV